MTLGDASVGSLVYLRVQGEYTPFRVMHHGKPDDTYDDSYTGGTILMMDHSAEPYVIPLLEETDGVRDNYDTSYPHKWLNQTFLTYLDEKVRELVTEVKLPYRSDTEGSAALSTGSEGLPARVWLPSMAEAAKMAMYGADYGPMYIHEGAAFEYWQGKTAEDYSAWKVLNDSGSDVGWCLRTPNYFVSGTACEFFFKVHASGDARIATQNTAYVRPCLVLPDGLRLDGDSYIQVGVSLPVKVDGEWKQGTPFVKVDGLWRQVASVHVKVDGEWKQ